MRNGKSKKLIIAVLAIWLVIGIVIFAIYRIFMVKTITYIGNRHYNDEEMTQYIFDEDNPNMLIYRFFKKKDRDIPFIQKYDVEYYWPDKLVVTVYEKAIVGYINYMGCNMYFDRDGVVVESSTQDYEGVPEISGLKFASIVVGAKLNVGDDSVFDMVLDLTQSFNKYQLEVDKVFFDTSKNVILYIGDVKVNLGNSSDYTDKLFELKQMIGEFDNLKGTLHMEDYTGDETSIIFKKDK